MAEGLTSFAAREGPVYLRAISVRLAIPDSCFLLEHSQVGKPASAKALSRKQTQLDFRLV